MVRFLFLLALAFNGSFSIAENKVEETCAGGAKALGTLTSVALWQANTAEQKASLLKKLIAATAGFKPGEATQWGVTVVAVKLDSWFHHTGDVYGRGMVDKLYQLLPLLNFGPEVEGLATVGDPTVEFQVFRLADHTEIGGRIIVNQGAAVKAGAPFQIFATPAQARAKGYEPRAKVGWRATATFDDTGKIDNEAPAWEWVGK